MKIIPQNQFNIESYFKLRDGVEMHINYTEAKKVLSAYERMGYTYERGIIHDLMSYEWGTPSDESNSFLIYGSQIIGVGFHQDPYNMDILLHFEIRLPFPTPTIPRFYTLKDLLYFFEDVQDYPGYEKCLNIMIDNNISAEDIETYRHGHFQLFNIWFRYDATIKKYEDLYR